MTVIEKKLSFVTKGNADIINLTPLVEQKLNESETSEGIITIFAPGATGGITTIEYEPGLINDLKEILEKIIPQDGFYKHNEKWGDGNGHSHLRASLIGPGITVPFTRKQLQLGTWQQIIFIDFDVKTRNRALILKIIGT